MAIWNLFWNGIVTNKNYFQLDQEKQYWDGGIGLVTINSCLLIWHDYGATLNSVADQVQVIWRKSSNLTQYKFIALNKKNSLWGKTSSFKPHILDIARFLKEGSVNSYVNHGY